MNYSTAICLSCLEDLKGYLQSVCPLFIGLNLKKHTGRSHSAYPKFRNDVSESKSENVDGAPNPPIFLIKFVIKNSTFPLNDFCLIIIDS